MATTSFLTHKTRIAKITDVADDVTFTVPASYAIEHIFIENTTANAITGGIKIGTTSGGVEVLGATAIGASFIDDIAEAGLIRRYFSSTAATTIYLQDVSAWNSAILNITVFMVKV